MSDLLEKRLERMVCPISICGVEIIWAIRGKTLAEGSEEMDLSVYLFQHQSNPSQNCVVTGHAKLFGCHSQI